MLVKHSFIHSDWLKVVTRSLVGKFPIKYYKMRTPRLASTLQRDVYQVVFHQHFGVPPTGRSCTVMTAWIWTCASTRIWCVELLRTWATWVEHCYLEILFDPTSVWIKPAKGHEKTQWHIKLYSRTLLLFTAAVWLYDVVSDSIDITYKPYISKHKILSILVPGLVRKALQFPHVFFVWHASIRLDITTSSLRWAWLHRLRSCRHRVGCRHFRGDRDPWKIPHGFLDAWCIYIIWMPNAPENAQGSTKPWDRNVGPQVLVPPKKTRKLQPTFETSHISSR